MKRSEKRSQLGGKNVLNEKSWFGTIADEAFGLFAKALFFFYGIEMGNEKMAVGF